MKRKSNKNCILGDITPTIPCHASVTLTLPKSSIWKDISRKIVTMLLDCRSNHNLINHKLPKILNYFKHPHSKFQVMVTNGGTINCSKKC